MRDINQDILSNPFDEELPSVTQPFATLLQSIVSTVDQHGLQEKASHGACRRKWRASSGCSPRNPSPPEVAESLRELKLSSSISESLFTFIRFDGVPWNNNSAENADQEICIYREGTVGTMTEAGLNDYLVLLSIYQTCRYKGVSFLKFLLSRQTDLDTFSEGKRPKQRPPFIEVYPDGFIPPLKKPTKPQQGDASAAPVNQIPSEGGPTDPHRGHRNELVAAMPNLDTAHAGRPSVHGYRVAGGRAPRSFPIPIPKGDEPCPSPRSRS